MHLITGYNKIRIDKVDNYLGYSINNWKAFLWYLTNHCAIVNFDDKESKTVEIKVPSKQNIERLKQKIKEYAPDMCENNYEVARENELWRTHHNNYWGTSVEMLEKILR
jgi:hypothetical protein